MWSINLGVMQSIILGAMWSINLGVMWSVIWDVMQLQGVMLGCDLRVSCGGMI